MPYCKLFLGSIVSCKVLLIQPTLDTMGSLKVMVISCVKTFGLQSSCNLRLGNPNLIPIMVFHLLKERIAHTWSTDDFDVFCLLDILEIHNFIINFFQIFCFLTCVMQEKLYNKTHGCCQYKLEGDSIPLWVLVIVEFVLNVFISKIGFQQFSLVVGAHIRMQLVKEFNLDLDNAFPFWIGLAVDKVVCHTTTIFIFACSLIFKLYMLRFYNVSNYLIKYKKLVIAHITPSLSSIVG